MAHSCRQRFLETLGFFYLIFLRLYLGFLAVPCLSPLALSVTVGSGQADCLGALQHPWVLGGDGR